MDHCFKPKDPFICQQFLFLFFLCYQNFKYQILKPWENKSFCLTDSPKKPPGNYKLNQYNQLSILVITPEAGVSVRYSTVISEKWKQRRYWSFSLNARQVFITDQTWGVMSFMNSRHLDNKRKGPISLSKGTVQQRKKENNSPIFIPSDVISRQLKMFLSLCCN